MASYNNLTSIPIHDYVDSHGKPVESSPRPVTCDFLKTLCRQGVVEDVVLGPDGELGYGGRTGLVRAFQPYAVTVMEYASEFQLEPTRREIFIYAPVNYTNPGALALGLWTRWFKPATNAIVDAFARPEYPKVGEAAIVDPQIGDDGYDDFWKFVKTRPHRHIGHPDRPIAFVCLDESVCAIGETLQKGLIRTV